MTSAEQLIEQIECAGGALVLYGERVRVRLPEGQAHLLDELRAHRNEVILLLRKLSEIPPMPPGVQLARWEPKPAPVVLTHDAVVTNVLRFISMTLLELKAAMAGQRWQSGHRSTRELIDRLEQCGVHVKIQSGQPRGSGVSAK